MKARPSLATLACCGAALAGTAEGGNTGQLSCPQQRAHIPPAPSSEGSALTDHVTEGARYAPSLLRAGSFARHACSRMRATAIKVGPMNRPRKPTVRRHDERRHCDHDKREQEQKGRCEPAPETAARRLTERGYPAGVF